MLWLILCAISFIGIFVVFKLIVVKKAPLLNCVVVNYLMATVLGFVVCGSIPLGEIVAAEWFPVGIVLGFLFIATFIIVGISSSRSGIGITTVASKMSLVIPMLFSIIAYGEPLSLFKIMAIVMAVASVILCTYKPGGAHGKTDIWKILLPVLLFLGMGVNDSLVVYSRHSLGAGDTAALFTATLFGMSLLFGIIYSLVKKGTMRQFACVKTWIFGGLLGAFNFGSIYFVIMTMNSGILATSAIYGICNISTVLLSIIIGRIFFTEKLTWLNIVGGLLALGAIVIMAVA